METINITISLFQCRQCELKCSSNFNLKNHVKAVHDKIKDIGCDKCDYKCSLKSALKQHVKIVHDKIKDNECDKCDFKCSRNSDLKQHIKMTHNKIKDIKCDKCDFVCCLNSGLKQHIKSIHDKIRDFKCDICDYECSQKGSLKQHFKQIHDKIKDFKCDICDYECSSKCYLKQHIEVIHINPKSKNMSRGEKAIYDHLVDLGYEFNKTFFKESTFNDLRGIGNGLLRFDFKVMIDDEKFVLIEFDGEQHEKPVKFSSITTNEEALEHFKLTRTHDRIKNDYCKDNGYEILRIRHDQVKLLKVMINEFIKN